MTRLPAVSLAAFVALFASGAHAADAAPSPAPSWATRYSAEEPFYHVVADRRFVGYYKAEDNACALHVLVGPADENDKGVQPLRMTFRLQGSQSLALAAGNRQSLDLACAANAGSLTVTTQKLPQNTAAARD